jgi:hypothetical protein
MITSTVNRQCDAKPACLLAGKGKLYVPRSSWQLCVYFLRRVFAESFGFMPQAAQQLNDEKAFVFCAPSEALSSVNLLTNAPLLLSLSF